ncbi:class I SAM-dependent methyltransferase [Lacibacter sp.]|uniref:class I SAM-dependent methyltransferase n=1 Tax=Lacibacter sp. TaxID=1915409 RepID=UPI002B4B4EC6|nr:class I SAM-dependent methyltransferase [Lacibacter sp.]HLP38473.1 class I SAM-dependent methyltransferase [Lacibacter sp.]
MSTKTTQGQLWSVAPQKWSQHFEPWFLPMYKTALRQLQLNEDHLLLDAGCGSGMFTAMAAKEGAEVIGIDAAPGLLEVARQRNPKSNFLEEDLEALPFEDNSFDVVAAFNSLQYAGSFERALAEATRVLKPGGRMVIGIWDQPQYSEATEVLKAIGSLLPPPPPGKPGPFALSEDGRIEEAFINADLKPLYKSSIPCPFMFSNLRHAAQAFMGTGPAAIALNSHSKTTVEETIEQAFKPFHITDDFFFLQNKFLLFIAEK